MISEKLEEHQKYILLNDAMSALNRGIKINPNFYLSVTLKDGQAKGLCCLVGAVVIAERNKIPHETFQIAGNRLGLSESDARCLMGEFSTWDGVEKGIGPERVKMIRDRIKELKL